MAILLFKKAYITIRYFRNIYVRPFLRKFLGYDSEIPLVMPKAPKKVKLFVGEFKVDILIPVYILRKISGIKHIHRHDRWWFVSTEDKKFICKPCFLKKRCSLHRVK